MIVYFISNISKTKHIKKNVDIYNLPNAKRIATPNCHLIFASQERQMFVMDTECRVRFLAC